MKQNKLSKSKRKKLMYKRRRRFFFSILLLIIIIIFSPLISSSIKNKYYGNKVNIFSHLRLYKNIDKEYPVNIVNVNYKWAEPLDTKSFVPTHIILHHSATEFATPQLIHNAHLHNGWKGIGYHFLITKDGTIYRGRPENAVGAHTKKNNYDSFGICLEGNFQIDDITSEQEDSLIKLCGMLMDKYSISTILKHSDVYNTACPGHKLNFNEIYNKSLEQSKAFKD